MKTPFLTSLAVCATLALASCSPAEETTPPTATPPATSETTPAVEEPPAVEEIQDVKIVLTTSKGDIEATIFATKVPMTAANFLNLAKRGYYDGITFHRVIPNFMIQGGDPTASGRGGPGYSFADEFDDTLKHDKPGIFSMANAGPGTNGSQFFITHKATPHLDGRHSVFGEVTKGQDVVNAIVGGDTITGIKILDSTELLFEAQNEKLTEWNAVLDARK